MVNWSVEMFNQSAFLKVHERSQEVDFILLLLRKLLRFNSPYVKACASLMDVISTTSSFATAQLSHFSTSNDPNKPSGHPHVSDHRLQAVCRVLQHSDQGHNVTGLHVRGGWTPSPHRGVLHGRHPDLSTQGETTTRRNVLCHFLATSMRQYLDVQQEDAAEPHISKEMYDVAICLIQKFDEMEGEESRYIYWIILQAFFNAKIIGACYCSRANKGDGSLFSERGSVLVFLPGMQEIRVMQEALAKLSHRRWECQSAACPLLVNRLFLCCPTHYIF